MSKQEENWNIYYCGDNDLEKLKNETSDENYLGEACSAEDIPVSKYQRIANDYDDYDYECEDENNDSHKKKKNLRLLIVKT